MVGLAACLRNTIISLFHLQNSLAPAAPKSACLCQLFSPYTIIAMSRHKRPTKPDENEVNCLFFVYDPEYDSFHNHDDVHCGNPWNTYHGQKADENLLVKDWYQQNPRNNLASDDFAFAVEIDSASVKSPFVVAPEMLPVEVTLRMSTIFENRSALCVVGKSSYIFSFYEALISYWRFI